jgi:UDP-GlcNAc:undecaprenyl-phosphate GlcNAc-1-phosphate transferase
MDQIINLLLTPLITAALISTLVTFAVIKLAKRLKIIDDPKKTNHPKIIHTVPTPRGGGIPILLAVSVTLLLVIPLDQHLTGILIGALLVCVMGYLDDRFNLNPYVRLAGGFLAASMPILAGIGISFLTNPFGGTIDLSEVQIPFNFLGETRSIWVFSDIFALLWIVFLMNILNMGAKGVDGQLSGVVIISALTIAALSFFYSADITQWPVIILAASVAGAFIGFFVWHKFPQKIMPGYGGATLAGYFLAIASILSTTKVGTLIVVLGIPLIDTGYTIIRRLMAGKSPVWGDTGHLHHKLLAAGLTKNQVAQIYWAATAVLGILALSLNSTYKLYTMIAVALLIGGLILLLAKKQGFRRRRSPYG